MKYYLSAYEHPGTITVIKRAISKSSLQTGLCRIECLISLGRFIELQRLGGNEKTVVRRITGAHAFTCSCKDTLITLGKTVHRFGNSHSVL